MEAIGMVETNGLLGSIVCLDTMLKTSNVSLAKTIKVGKGLTTVIVFGDVASVKTAVDAGSEASRKEKCFVSSHVIPRVSNQVVELFFKEEKIKPSTTPALPDKKIAAIEMKEVSEDIVIIENSEDVSTIKDTVTISENVATEKEVDFSEMNVGQLRSYLRMQNIEGVKKEKIKYMDRKTLLNVLMNNKKE